MAAQITFRVLDHPSNGLLYVAYSTAGFQHAGSGHDTNRQNHAILWSSQAGAFSDLNPAKAGRRALSSGINACDGSRQVGWAEFGNLRAALWSGTAESFVDLTPANSSGAVIYGLSGSQQGGYVLLPTRHAALWSGTADSFVDLHPPQAETSWVFAINGSQQVGQVDIHAALWFGTAASMVKLHPKGAYESYAYGTSGSQQVGMVRSFGSGYRAAFWSGTADSFIDLNPEGSVQSMAYGISGTWQVGAFDPKGGGFDSNAALWSGTASSLVNLHTVLGPDYKLSVAKSVFSDGSTIYVAGYALNSVTGVQEPILWTVTDPSAPRSTKLEITKDASNHPHIAVLGNSGMTFVLQSSKDLVTGIRWRPMSCPLTHRNMNPRN